MVLPRSSTLSTSMSALALASLVACGGGTAPPTTGADPGRRELLEARQRAVMAEVEAERLASEVEELERQLKLARQQAATAPTARPAAPVVDDVSGVDLGGTIEELELEEPPAAPPARPTTIAGGEPGGAAQSQSIYDRAYAFFHEKRYADAEQEFRRFLQMNPQSHLADNAQFWIGECRYARGDFSSALAAFSETVDRYPHGNKVADALLKAAKCLEALGQREQAIDTYDELAARFPESAAALVAEGRLRELRP